MAKKFEKRFGPWYVYIQKRVTVRAEEMVVKKYFG